MTAVVDFVRTIPATKVDAAVIAAKSLAKQDETGAVAIVLWWPR